MSRGRQFSFTACLLAGVAAIALQAAAVHAQAAQTQPAEEASERDDRIVVTGSRIARPEVATSAPLTVIDQQALTDRGFVQAGQALNDATSITPSVPQTAFSGGSSGGGQQYPALFGLGAGRTLTLVNGRRTVATANGIGNPVVDTNSIPTGLLSRVEIVQGGGAAVYGSGAIAGVVNYVLRDDFEGVQIDAQTGISSRDDYPVHSLRLTAGRNFFDGRANLAANFEWSRSEPLLADARPETERARVTVANPADTGPNDGIPSLREIFDARFWSFNANGVLFFPPAPIPTAFITADGTPFPAGGVPLQMGPGGMPIPYNPGQLAGIPFASGGDGLRYNELGALYSGVERRNINVIGHYDFDNGVRLSTELLWSHTQGEDARAGRPSNTILNPAASGNGALAFNRFNPFLSADAVAALSAAYPAFGFGAPIFISKMWNDLLNDDSAYTTTEVYRALAALDGMVEFGNREYDWSASISHGRADGNTRSWGVWQSRFNNAINAVLDGSGNIVCAINNDGNPATNDPACAPLNPFGEGNVSQAARDYINTVFGQTYTNTQTNFLATFGGTAFSLPAGDLAFVAAYEYRHEDADFVPRQANLQGLGRQGVPTAPESGSYNTHEYSLEVLVPLIGGATSMPLVEDLEFSGVYRRVEHSIAGGENIWNAGLRWTVNSDFVLRASRSRNFRAPNLNQLFAPVQTANSSVGIDPCDFRYIDSGPNPSVRRANCEAEWAANPGYEPLPSFQNSSTNFQTALVTTAGNPDLRNELSDTTTYGFIFEPSFVPGLTIIADRVEVDLTDGLSVFGPAQFLAVCYDSSTQSQDFCGGFTRDATGQVVAANSSTVNAGRVHFRGEVYNINYDVPLDAVFARDVGELNLNLEATHVSRLETSVTGFDLSRTDGTVAQPDWVARFDARYTRGPVRLSYTLNYLPEVLRQEGSNIENDPNPVVGNNFRHNVSGQFQVNERFAIRGGVNNLTDERPSYPTLNHGDIIGRYYFVGIRANL